MPTAEVLLQMDREVNISHKYSLFLIFFFAKKHFVTVDTNNMQLVQEVKK